MKTFFARSLFLAGIASSSPVLCARADGIKPNVAQRPLEKAPLTITDQQGQKHLFTVEIARTEKEKEAGETLRASVPDGTGMLFLFTPPEAAAMWMRDTPASLDMVFIAPDGHIQAIVEKAVPFSERRLTGNGDSSAVLEVAAGTMEKNGIVVGDAVSSKALQTAG
ncbi:DUF192 domain-containing protein [Asaia platycodi]|uniref:DUF192 domain-containing protein n=1 Tax=Asaia platycodi TaxID=610243 RepID=UPI0005539585|nr:DUF192 domain-containing protein [Asaia platycodi]